MNPGKKFVFRKTEEGTATATEAPEVTADVAEAEATHVPSAFTNAVPGAFAGVGSTFQKTGTTGIGGKGPDMAEQKALLNIR